MDFNLTEVQQDFMNLARDFGEKRLAPTIMERDHQAFMMMHLSLNCSAWASRRLL